MPRRTRLLNPCDQHLLTAPRCQTATNAAGVPTMTAFTKTRPIKRVTTTKEKRKLGAKHAHAFASRSSLL